MGQSAQRPTSEVFGFVYAQNLANQTYGYPSWTLSALSTVDFFALGVANDGSLYTTGPGWNVWNSSVFSSFLTQAHQAGVKVVVTIDVQTDEVNYPNDPNFPVCSALQHRQTTVATTVREVMAKGVDGVNVDYEGLGNPCGGRPSADLLVELVQGLRANLPAANSYLSIDTYGGSAGGGGGFFNIPALNPYVDAFMVMAYDAEYSNWRSAGCNKFCLGPTAPLTGYAYNDTNEMSQYSAAVGAGKVILGIPYYGRKACVASPPTAHGYPIQKPNALNDSWVDADRYVDAFDDVFNQGLATARSTDAGDPSGAEPWATWRSNNYGCDRELYWDDAASIGRKYDLVLKGQLRGVGLFTLDYGGARPELWNQLVSHFTYLPGAPANVEADGVDGGANVSWSVPVLNSGTPLTDYVITATPGGLVTHVAPTNHPSARVSGLSNGTPYSFQVAAVNAAGAGPMAAPSNSTTPTSGPRHRSYFAEGTTLAGFQEYLSIENLGDSAIATVTFLFADGSAPFFSVQPLMGNQRTTLDVNSIVGAGRDVSMIVDSASGSLVAERPLYFRACPAGLCVDGGHVGVGLAPRTAWYFAEGYTGPGFHEYLTLLNPSSADSTASIRYQFRSGPGLPDQAVSIRAFGRATVDVNAYVGAGRDVSAIVTGATPIVVERPMYFSACLEGVCMNGGDVVGGGVPLSAMNFAEGSTRAGILEYLTLANPGASDVAAQVTYQFGEGQGPARTIAYTIAAHSRQTISVNQEVGAGKDVSVAVAAVGGQLIAERPEYFNLCLPVCVNGGHVAVGAAASPTWYFAEGFTGAGFKEYLTIGNPGAETAMVQITYLAGDGSSIPLQTFPVPGHGRVTVDVGSVVGANRSVGAAILADHPVIAERPLYFNACLGAVCVDGGSDATGIPAPL